MTAGYHSHEMSIQDPSESTIAVSGSGHRPLTVKTVTDVEEFGGMGNQWNALAENSASTVYQTFEWNWLWWKHFGTQPSRSLHLLLFYAEESLVGIAPFFTQETSAAGALLNRSLQFLGSGSGFIRSNGVFFDDGVSDYLDFIVKGRYEREICTAFIEYLNHATPPIDDVWLLNTMERSTLMKTLRDQCGVHGLHINVSRADVCSRMEVNESFESLQRRQSANVRRRFTQARKAFEQGGTHIVRTVQSPEDLESAFVHLVRLHQHRWNDLGYPGLFADKKFELFQSEIARAFMEKGWLSFKTSNVNGTCVATRLAFTFNGCMYDYLSGFDPGASTTKQRPGLGLLLAMIEESIKAEVTRIDFLRGDEKYKFDFNPIMDHNWNIQIDRGSQGNAVRRLLHRVVRNLGMISFITRREWTLVGVQWRVHGTLRFFFKYLQFRAVRFTNKFTRRDGSSGDAMLPASLSKNI